MLADEPTGDLDEKTGDEIMDLFAALHSGHKKTIVMVTHDVEKAGRATRQLYFSQGKVSDQAPPQKTRGAAASAGAAP